MGVSGTINHLQIAAIAAAVPGQPVENATYLSRVGEEGVRKFAKMTGVMSRHHVQTLKTSDLAFAAAEQLRMKGHWNPESVDAVLFVSQTADASSPSTACILHGRLALHKACAAMDIQLGCSGFIYGLLSGGGIFQCKDFERYSFWAETVSVGFVLLMTWQTKCYLAMLDLLQF
ncbi:MAG: hypothetical protein RSB14_02080 [Kiritimatiellia bacterium]